MGIRRRRTMEANLQVDPMSHHPLWLQANQPRAATAITTASLVIGLETDQKHRMMSRKSKLDYLP